MPQMKGRSLEELDEMFLEKVSMRNFTKYECRIKEDALRDVRDDRDFKRGVVERTEDITKAITRTRSEDDIRRFIEWSRDGKHRQVDVIKLLSTHTHLFTKATSTTHHLNLRRIINIPYLPHQKQGQSKSSQVRQPGADAFDTRGISSFTDLLSSQHQAMSPQQTVKGQMLPYHEHNAVIHLTVHGTPYLLLPIANYQIKRKHSAGATSPATLRNLNVSKVLKALYDSAGYPDEYTKVLHLVHPLDPHLDRQKVEEGHSFIALAMSAYNAGLNPITFDCTVWPEDSDSEED